MARWRIVRIVTRREARERATSKVFVLTTGLMVAGAVLAAVVPTLQDKGKEETLEIGVVGSPPPALAAALRFATKSTGRKATTVEIRSRAAGDAALRKGDLDLVLEGATGIRMQGEGTSRATRELAGLLARTVPLRTGLGSAGVAPRDVDRLLATPPLPVSEVEPRQGDGDDDDARSAVAIGGMVLYIALVSYGTWVATGVLEEKASRVVEVVLAAIRPGELLAGKVLGIGLLGLGQLVLVGGVGLGVALVAGVEVPSSAPTAVALVILWFALGFAFYSCGFAALGAAASRHEDAQSAMSPLIALLVAGFLLSGAVQADPDGMLARVGTFIPPLAPLIVPARTLLGDTPLWELALSIVLMVVASYGLIRLGARAYGGAVLRFGPKLSIRELWRGSSSQVERAVDTSRNRVGG